MRHIFREYDIRGIYEKEITPSFCKALGEVLGQIIKEKNATSVSVGYDVRLSNEILHNALIYGLNQSDLKVFSLGLVPTPLGYFSTHFMDIDANIMITASHNPKEYNGFKITIKNESFFGKELASIYEKVFECMKKYNDKIEKVVYEKIDIINPYVDFLVSKFQNLKNLKTPICIDTANGASSEVAKMVLDKLNIKYASFFDEFDGNFSAHEPDPTNPKNLFALTSELDFDEDNLVNNLEKNEKKYAPKYHNNYEKNTAKIGFGFDGDGDRLAVVLKNRFIKGDELCYLFSYGIKNPKILCEVKCSKVIFDEITKRGECFMGKTGHSNIKKSIKELGVDLAAELSGHIFFNDRYFGYDDGVYAMLRVIELYETIDFEAILNDLPKVFASDEIKIKVDESIKFQLICEFEKLILKSNLGAKIIQIDGVRAEFKDGFFLLRASNTSPYLIARYESKEQKNLLKYKNIIKQTLEQAKQNLKKL